VYFFFLLLLFLWWKSHLAYYNEKKKKKKAEKETPFPFPFFSLFFFFSFSPFQVASKLDNNVVSVQGFFFSLIKPSQKFSSVFGGHLMHTNYPSNKDRQVIMPTP
jgi:hypothetical protein